jgi:hypothetical protein
MTNMQALNTIVKRAFNRDSVECPFCGMACPDNGPLVLVGHYDHCPIAVLKSALQNSRAPCTDVQQLKPLKSEIAESIVDKQIREADCCHNCEKFRCENYSCWGKCIKHPKFDVVYFNTICDDFEKRTREMLFYEIEEVKEQ